MEFWILGVNHKRCPLGVREKIHFSGSVLEEALAVMRDDFRIAEGAVLSTCNRVECLLLADGEARAREFFFSLLERLSGTRRESFSDYVEALEAGQAVRHVMRVAAGLESLVLGEDEILGQIREAFSRARASGAAGTFLHRLFEKALKSGKDVRSKTRINRGATSIPSAAVELVRKIAGRVQGERVLVLGTGEMGRLTLRHLRKRGANIVYVISRRAADGQRLSTEFGSQWLPFGAWESVMPEVDILITATACPVTVISATAVERVMLGRGGRPLFIIDIAVPRDVDPSVGSMGGVYLYNVDDLKGIAAENLRLREQEIHDAERMIEKAAGHFTGWAAGFFERRKFLPAPGEMGEEPFPETLAVAGATARLELR